MTRTIDEPPNVENTVPLHLFRAQSPARHSHLDGDKAVLYAGASNTNVHISGHGQGGVYRALSERPVSIYVLNTSLVLWVPARHTGVDITYPLIVLHAVKEQNGQEVLYLQVAAPESKRGSSRSETDEPLSGLEKAQPETEGPLTTEIVLGLGDSGGEATGLLSQRASVRELYEALSTCLSFHYDSDSDSDGSGQPDSGSLLSSQWFTANSLPAEAIAVPASWLNSGDADDLGMDLADESDLQEEAGMNVALNHRPVAGVSRKSQPDELADKRRRID